MTSGVEKRTERRYCARPALVCRIHLSGTHYSVVQRDHNASGLSFESDFYLKPKTVVYLRRESCPENCLRGKACEHCRSMCLATIKWCREIQAGVYAYAAGAKYLE